jgi:hypothetical protein
MLFDVPLARFNVLGGITPVVRNLTHLRRASVFLALSFALASTGCLFSPDEGDGGGGDDTRIVERNSIDNTLTYIEQVWSKQLYDRYEEVLHDQYEFYPLQEDADDLPWLEGDSWGRTAELGMANNMFDPNFTGGNGAVDLIELDLVKQSERLLDETEQRYEVTCTQIGRVMWTATDGASFDTRVQIELVPDPDQPGYWQMIKQIEIPRT